MSAAVDAATEFSAFYAEHHHALLRFARRRIPDDGAARDLVAETFLIAWQKWDVVSRAAGLPWLYRVARGVLANQRRREATAALTWQRLADETDPTVAPPDAAAREALEAWSGLGPADQEVLRLHAWEGLSGRDLAQVLGCSTAAAAVRLHRARRRLVHTVAEQPEPTALPTRLPHPTPVPEGDCDADQPS